MKQTPLLFTTEMVQAMLDGRKDKTRRVFKMPKDMRWDEHLGGEAQGSVCSDDGTGWCDIEELYCPYGREGDLIWVREALNFDDESGDTWYATHVPTSLGNPHGRDHGPVPPETWVPPAYGSPVRSIHSPRWASRLTLRITDVRAERVQDISGADCLSEGVGMPVGTKLLYGSVTDQWNRDAFRRLWDAINADRGFGWESNPWVWVISFEVIQKNIDEVIA